MYYDIVFHFDKGVDELKVVVSNVNNYYNGLENEVFSAVLVVNGPGIEFMGKDGQFAAQLMKLSERGLDIRVCKNAMANFNREPEWLNPVCHIVPAGLLELVDLQRKGFVYVKP